MNLFDDALRLGHHDDRGLGLGAPAQGHFDGHRPDRVGGGPHRLGRPHLINGQRLALGDRLGGVELFLDVRGLFLGDPRRLGGFVGLGLGLGGLLGLGLGFLGQLLLELAGGTGGGLGLRLGCSGCGFVGPGPGVGGFLGLGGRSIGQRLLFRIERGRILAQHFDDRPFSQPGTLATGHQHTGPQPERASHKDCSGDAIGNECTHFRKLPSIQRRPRPHQAAPSQSIRPGVPGYSRVSRPYKSARN